MKLKSQYDKQEDIPEALREYYEEKDGKWVLDSDFQQVDTRRLTNDLATERRKRQEFEAKVRKWEELGKTDEEIAELIAKSAELETQTLERKGEWDKLRQQMVDTHNAALKKLNDKLTEKDAEIKRRDQSIQNLLIDTSATAAIAANEGDPELLMPFVRNQLRVIEDEGKHKVQIVDAQGGPRVNGKGEPLSVAELVAEMRQNEKYGRLFKGSGASGGGTPPGGGGGGGGSHQFKRRSDFKTEKDRAAFIDAHGLEAYSALPT